MNTIVSATDVFWRVVTVFSLTVFGVIARKSGTLKEEARQSLADTIMNITLPSLIFVSMTSDISWDRLVSGAISPFLALGLVLLMMVVAMFVGRFIPMTDERRRTFMVLCSMPNTSFIAFPVILSLLGQEGLAYAVLYDIGTTVAFCSVAILVLHGGVVEKGTWKALLNPALIATVIGLTVKRMGFEVPELVLAPFRIMGNATVPLAMLFTGYLLAGLGFQRSAISLELGIVCLLKLFVYPVLACFLILPFDVDPLVRTVVIIQAAMPSMASAPVLVQKYGGDGEFAVASVFTTTLLSVLTIPLMIGLLG